MVRKIQWYLCIQLRNRACWVAAEVPYTTACTALSLPAAGTSYGGNVHALKGWGLLPGSWRTVLLRSQHKVHRGGRTYVLPSPVECSFPGGSIRHRVWPLKLSPAPTGIYKPDCRNFRNYCLCHTTSEIIQQIGLSRKSLACAWLSLKTEADCSQQLLGIYTAWGSLITSHAGQRIKMLPYYRSVTNTRWFNSIHLTLLCSSHTFTCYWHHPGRWPASLG